jgi:hypothetical protein
MLFRERGEIASQAENVLVVRGCAKRLNPDSYRLGGTANEHHVYSVRTST